MSLYRETPVYAHQHEARYFEDQPRRSGELVIYKEPPSPHHGHHHHRHYHPQVHRHRGRHRTDGRIVRSRSLHRRDSSSDCDYEQRSRRKSLVVTRPRSASRVRLVEPALVVHTSSSCSSSDEGTRYGGRHRKRDDDVKIRAKSRPGKPNQYAFVRHPSKKKRKSKIEAVVQDVDYRTDHHHRHFKHRRDDLETREAAVLVRTRSRERLGLRDHDSDSDDRYSSRQYRNSHVIDHRRRSIRDPNQYDYGSGLIDAGYENQRRPNVYAPRSRRLSLSPDRESVMSSRADGSVRRAASTVSKPKTNRTYEGSVAGSDMRSAKHADPPYLPDADRRAKERERDAIEREQRAIRREEVALDREKYLVGREMQLPVRSAEDDKRRGPNDYLRDGQKYYKTGQGVVAGAKKLFG